MKYTIQKKTAKKKRPTSTQNEWTISAIDKKINMKARRKYAPGTRSCWGCLALDSVGHLGVGVFVVPAGVFFVRRLVLACSSVGAGAVGGICAGGVRGGAGGVCGGGAGVVLVGAVGVGIGVSIVLVGGGFGVGGICADGGVCAGAGGVGVDPFTPLVGTGVVLMCPSYPLPLLLVLEVACAGGVDTGTGGIGTFLPLVGAGAMLMCPSYSLAVALVLMVALALVMLALACSPL